MITGADLEASGPHGDKRAYAEMIGTLNFAATSTRPDLACAVSMESSHLQQPTKAHIKLARNTVSYAAATAHYGLLYRRAPELTLSAYCDASFAPSDDMRKSRSGWLALINGTPVSWKSGKQPIIAHSTAEAEYIALSDASRELMYLRRLLQELGHQFDGPATVFEDNQTAKLMAEEIATKRAKHVDIRYHSVRHLVDQGRITIEYCPTDDMIADLLTKPLARDRFCTLRDRFMAKGEC
jgi:hypothetical protein